MEEAADKEGAGLVESSAPTVGEWSEDFLNDCVERYGREEKFG
jgi:hypothetical protein